MELICIYLIRLATNGQKSLFFSRIHQSTSVLSEKNLVILIVTSRTFITDWANLNPSVAPISSSLGMIIGVRGSTFFRSNQVTADRPIIILVPEI